MSELSSRQVRALILLLIIAPLIPAALMMQLMIGSVQSEQLSSQDRARAFLAQALPAARTSLATRLRAERGKTQPQIAALALSFLRESFNGSARVRLFAPGQQVQREPGVTPVEVRLDDPLPGWRIQLLPPGADGGAGALHYQVTLFTAVGGAAILLNLSIACLAGYALNRQMRVHELKSSSLEKIAHELKTPLASTRVLLDTLLARQDQLDSATVDYIHLISAANSRLIHLTETFLTMARLERGGVRFERRESQPAALAASAAEAVGSRVRQAALQIDIPAGLPTLDVDPDAIAVALANLIDNAAKYSEGHGDIILRARRENGGVEFQVIDHGAGIPRAQQRKVFDRFYQVNQTLARSHDGCGLGLSIVKSIAQAHGGTVRLQSTEGEGTTVSIYLPASSMHRR
jgi:signal transduction histidine kinase